MSISSLALSLYSKFVRAIFFIDVCRCYLWLIFGKVIFELDCHIFDYSFHIYVNVGVGKYFWFRNFTINIVIIIIHSICP